MIQIIPAILVKTEEDFNQQLQEIESSESLRNGWVHIDFADNQFVPNQTVGVEVLQQLSTQLQIEVHLMVAQPSEWVDKLLKAGVKRVIAHAEIGEEELNIFFAQINVVNVESGLALNPETLPESVENYLHLVNTVLVMTIHPGFQGQPFIPQTLEKVRRLAKLRLENNLSFLIGVDGGINENTILDATLAGIDYAVIGSALIKGDIEDNLERLKQKIS